MRSILILTILFTPLVGHAQSTAPLPKELGALQQQYLKAIDVATLPITKRYLQELTALQKKYTMAGDLNAALAVKGILDGLALNQPSETVATTTSIGPSKKELIATLNGTVWSGTWQYGDITFTFQGETVIIDAGTKWEHQGKIEVTSPRKLTVTVEPKPETKKLAMIHTLEMAKDGLTITGTREVKVMKKP